MSSNLTITTGNDRQELTVGQAFDQRVAIEAVRKSLKILDPPQRAKDQVRLIVGPEDRTDEAIPQEGDKYVTLQQYCSNGIRWDSQAHVLRHSTD